MVTIATLYKDAPFGALYIRVENEALTRLTWAAYEDTSDAIDMADAMKQSPVIQQVIDELQAYFEGELKAFTVPLHYAKGTEFQKRVWRLLEKIPYGESVTYGDIAQELKSAPRAVGGAVGANPIPIIVPCHRVMGASGKLTGFSGGDGVPTKIKLLDHEGIEHQH